MDIFNKKIVGCSIHEEQNAALSASPLKQACIDENISEGKISLHSDNGGPMKGATMPAMMQKLGVIPSFSLSSVSSVLQEAISNDIPLQRVLTELPFLLERHDLLATQQNRGSLDAQLGLILSFCE